MADSNQDIEVDYKIRINKVFKYIDEHLDGQLLLGDVAAIASFSPFHFHRIFKAVTGERLTAYITRRRIEKAALELIHKKMPLAEIYLKYGFSDSSSFSRTFKKFYGVSPTEFKNQNPNKFSKLANCSARSVKSIRMLKNTFVLLMI